MNINTKTETLSAIKLKTGVETGEIVCQAFEHWDEDAISDYIDSILMRLPMNPIILVEERKFDEIWYSVADGNKRLEAIHAFMTDRVAITRSVMYFYENIVAKTFSEIARPMQRIIEQTEIVTRIIRLGTDAAAKKLIIERLGM